MKHNELITVKYNIKGLDCPSCANKIEIFCNKISGVNQAKINFTTSLFTLNFYNNSDTRDKVEKGIKNLGFELTEIPEAIKYNGEKTHLRIKEKLKREFVISNNKKSNYFNKIKEKKLSTEKVDNHKLEHNHTKEQSHDHSHDSTNWLPITFLSIAFALSWIVEYFSKSFGLVSFAIVTLIALLPILKKSWIMIKVGYVFSVETLMSISAIGAIFIGASEEAAAVIILFMLGETIEGYTSRRAKKGIQSLASLLPDTSLLVTKEGTTKQIKSSEIKIGDHIEIKPGERLAIDGEIFKGTANIDESLLTGESLPVYKKQGDKVVAGSINTDGNIIVKATLPGNNNAVTRMLKMVEEAQSSKSRVMRSIESFSRIYTPIILLIGLLTAIIPPLFFQMQWVDWIYRGLTILLIGCPCALVISTPSAIASAITAATKMGILIKNASALESLGKIKKIAFDKTGTITHGKLKVTNVISFESNEEKLLKFAGMVESKSTHPLAIAILNEVFERKITLNEVQNAKNLSGKGASALIENKIAIICSPIYANELNALNLEQNSLIKSYQEQGKTIAVVLIEQKALGFIALSDTLKPEAKSSIEKLKQLGINSIILTGDNKISANAITKNINTEVIAELLPENKLSYIQNISKEQKVAMVGDGINDAPALAAAEIGIAMGGGTDVAVDTSQIVISKNNLNSIVDAIVLSRKTMINIKQNIFLAIGLKAIFLILTIFGDTQLWMAILADTGATVLVTLNALRLLKFKSVQIE